MLQYPDAPLVDFAVRRANLTAPEWEFFAARLYLHRLRRGPQLR